MRILFYHAARAWGGSARAFAVAARGLSERGHSVTFVCHPESPVEQRLEFGAYEVLPRSTDGPWPLAMLHLRRALQERLTEAVFVHGEREHLVAAAAARLTQRAAVLRRVPYGAPLTQGLRSRLACWLATSGFIFGSEDERQRAPRIRRARLAPEVIPLGVNVQAYDAVRPASRASIGAGGGARLLACLCDRTSRVRAASVLRVMALLVPLHPELRLALLGPGSDNEDLRMHAAALRITRNVSFLGERDDYLSVLNVADLGWVVASGDNAVFALLDLLASKVPVLAERGTVAQQVVPDGIAGILLPTGDTPDTAAAVARLLAHDEERIAMGNAGRVRVARDFSEAAMIEAFERAALAASDRARW